MALRDRFLGDPARLDAAGLGRGVRHGSEGFAVRCLRWLGERPDPEARGFLEERLGDEHAAVRRAAAWSLAHRAERASVPALRAAWGRERTEEGLLALAVALARAGDGEGPIRDALRAVDERSIETAYGARSPGEATAVGTLLERFELTCGGPRTDLRAARRRAVLAHEGRVAILGLAALRHPEDTSLLIDQIQASGRREEHVLFMALGWSGAPEAAELLRDALRATDVDPGRGFAQRRLAATALGRIGLRMVTPWLLRALEDEALDYEGRPGAGLGIQYPVRSTLLWALGEVADPAAIPTLLGYLGNTHGSAFGGFYLPAMDALSKMGAPAVPALQATLPQASELAAANALGVLHALGQPVAPWRADPRPAVAALAKRVEPR